MTNYMTQGWSYVRLPILDVLELVVLDIMTESFKNSVGDLSFSKSDLMPHGTDGIIVQMRRTHSSIGSSSL